MKRINQKTGQRELGLEIGEIGETWTNYLQGIQLLTEEDLSERLSKNELLLELILSEGNITQAVNQVRSNKGAPGVDGMKTSQLENYLKKNWQSIRKTILEGKYKPQAVKAVEIPKANGGKRQLGIPTVIDRTIQQAINQILQQIWDPRFAENSYGFRPKKSAQQALQKLKENIAEGNAYSVDIDLKNFFNEVNHDKLMYRMSQVIKDKRVLKLIRKYLQSGILMDGIVSQKIKGTPQGSPLSPLLSNIVLNELDQELEKRNHKFVRYADDFIVLVKSERAGERVKSSIKRYLEQELKLLINEEKSQIVRSNQLEYLGYRILGKEKPRLSISWKAQEKLKREIKERTRRTIGRNLETVIKELNSYLRGWLGYFGNAETPSVFEKYNQRIRRRLRSLIWKQWKRGKRRYREFRKLGLPKELARCSASSNKGPQHQSMNLGIHMALDIEFFDKLGLIKLQTRTC